MFFLTISIICLARLSWCDDCVYNLGSGEEIDLSNIPKLDLDASKWFDSGTFTLDLCKNQKESSCPSQYSNGPGNGCLGKKINLINMVYFWAGGGSTQTGDYNEYDKSWEITFNGLADPSGKTKKENVKVKMKCDPDNDDLGSYIDSVEDNYFDDYLTFNVIVTSKFACPPPDWKWGVVIGLLVGSIICLCCCVSIWVLNFGVMECRKLDSYDDEEKGWVSKYSVILCITFSVLTTVLIGSIFFICLVIGDKTGYIMFIILISLFLVSCFICICVASKFGVEPGEDDDFKNGKAMIATSILCSVLVVLYLGVTGFFWGIFGSDVATIMLFTGAPMGILFGICLLLVGCMYVSAFAVGLILGLLRLVFRRDSGEFGMSKTVGYIIVFSGVVFCVIFVISIGFIGFCYGIWEDDWGELILIMGSFSLCGCCCCFFFVTLCASVYVTVEKTRKKDEYLRRYKPSSSSSSPKKRYKSADERMDELFSVSRAKVDSQARKNGVDGLEYEAVLIGLRNLKYKYSGKMKYKSGINTFLSSGWRSYFRSQCDGRMRNNYEAKKQFISAGESTETAIYKFSVEFTSCCLDDICKSIAEFILSEELCAMSRRILSGGKADENEDKMGKEFNELVQYCGIQKFWILQASMLVKKIRDIVDDIIQKTGEDVMEKKGFRKHEFISSQARKLCDELGNLFKILPSKIESLNDQFSNCIQRFSTEFQEEISKFVGGFDAEKMKTQETTRIMVILEELIRICRDEVGINWFDWENFRKNRETRVSLMMDKFLDETDPSDGDVFNFKYQELNKKFWSEVVVLIEQLRKIHVEKYGGNAGDGIDVDNQIRKLQDQGFGSSKDDEKHALEVKLFYEVSKVLGKGAQGSVMVLKRRLDGREFAMKLVKLHGGGLKERRSLVYEVNIHSRLKHPYLTAFEDIFFDDHFFYLIMEKGEETLQSVIEKGIKLPENLIWKYFIQMVLGLNYMHRQGVIHRDIKPANILLSSNGEIKLCDFGLSRVLETKETTEYGGTPLYSSPQQLAIIDAQFNRFGKNVKYSEKVDVWSVGVILYELSCEFYLCHPTNKYFHIFQEINKGKITQEIYPEYSTNIKTIIQHLLQVDEENRFNTVDILSMSCILEKSKELGIEYDLENIKYDSSSVFIKRKRFGGDQNMELLFGSFESEEVQIQFLNDEEENEEEEGEEEEEENNNHQKKTIYFIQTVPGSPERAATVFRNLIVIDILKLLQLNCSIDKIFVDGFSGTADLSKLKSIPDQRIRYFVCKQLLIKGSLSPMEFYGIVFNRKFQITGADDMKLYHICRELILRENNFNELIYEKNIELEEEIKKLQIELECKNDDELFKKVHDLRTLNTFKELLNEINSNNNNSNNDNKCAYFYGVHNHIEKLTELCKENHINLFLIRPCPSLKHDPEQNKRLLLLKNNKDDDPLGLKNFEAQKWRFDYLQGIKFFEEKEYKKSLDFFGRVMFQQPFFLDNRRKYLESIRRIEVNKILNIYIQYFVHRIRELIQEKLKEQEENNNGIVENPENMVVIESVSNTIKTIKFDENKNENNNNENYITIERVNENIGLLDGENQPVGNYNSDNQEYQNQTIQEEDEEEDLNRFNSSGYDSLGFNSVLPPTNVPPEGYYQEEVDGEEVYI